MKAAANPVQAAIYTLLNGDTGAGGLRNAATPLVTGIFDIAGVPPGQLYPYITIGDFLSVPFGTFTRDGEDMIATLRIWSQQQMMEAAYNALNRCNELLGNASLTVAGYALARSIFDRYSPLVDPEDDVESVIVQYRIWLQES